MKFVKSRGKRTLEKVRNANEKLRETRGGGTMRKTMEQIVLEGQVAKCRSIEELFIAVVKVLHGCRQLVP